MDCRLCHKNKAIEDSHIIPALAHRAMKKKSPTPFFRRPTEPNRRLQDGVKCKLLCPKCEDLFNTWETPFSNQIFQPIYVKNNPAYRFSYDEWFLKFAVSVSWRSLTCLVEEYPDKELHQKVNSALQSWRDYLLEDSSNIGSFNQHVLVIDEIENVGNDPIISKKNEFLKAAIWFDTVHSDKNAYIFSKICNILIAGVIYETNPVWKGTQILKSGEYGPGDFTAPHHLSSFLDAGVEMMLKSRNDISEKQSRIIGQSIKK